MNVGELVEILSQYPKDSIVMYRHNKYGRIDIDTVIYTEEQMNDKMICTLTLEGKAEED